MPSSPRGARGSAGAAASTCIRSGSSSSCSTGARSTSSSRTSTGRAGGLTESLKICALAEAAGLPVVPHSNEAHNLHLVFSRAPSVCPVVEYFPDAEPDTGNELFWKLFGGNPRAGDGMLREHNPGGIGVKQRLHDNANAWSGEQADPLTVGDGRVRIR